jgi:hypothetical protein
MELYFHAPALLRDKVLRFNDNWYLSSVIAIFIYTITPGVPGYCAYRQVPYFAIGLIQIALRLYPYGTEIFCQGCQLLLPFSCCHQARKDTRDVRVCWHVCWTELCVADKVLNFKALINFKGLIKLYD